MPIYVAWDHCEYSLGERCCGERESRAFQYLCEAGGGNGVYGLKIQYDVFQNFWLMQWYIFDKC